jgi:hypothetical protein
MPYAFNHVDYASYVASMAWTMLSLCCSMLASMAWTMRLPMLASMIHLWAIIRGKSFPVTNSLSKHAQDDNTGSLACAEHLHASLNQS